jgi:hypothetical protein
MMILGGILGRCFCRNAARVAKSLLPPRGITASSSGRSRRVNKRDARIVHSEMFASTTEGESSAFWSSRTALRLSFSSSKKVQKGMSCQSAHISRPSL